MRSARFDLRLCEAGISTRVGALRDIRHAEPPGARVDAGLTRSVPLPLWKRDRCELASTRVRAPRDPPKRTQSGFEAEVELFQTRRSIP